jgi:hypothetical protein
MTISYPLTLPTSLGIERFSWTNFNVVGMTRSPFTFATQAQQHQGQLWSAEVGVGVATERTKVEPWMAFLTSLMGTYGTFLMGDPMGRTAMGVATGTPLVNGAGQTGNTLATDGWSINTTNILKKGDYIQVGQRLYKVLSDHNTNASGQTTLDIWPRLRESPADNAAIITSNTVGLFRLADSEVKIHELDRELIYSISFAAVEAI